MTMYVEDEGNIKTCDFATREELEAGIGIGSRVLEFDQNRRIYHKPPAGKIYATGGPVHRGHYRAVEVVDETSRSWVLSGWNKRKIPKKSLKGIYSNECADRAGWLHANRYEIVRAVERKLHNDDYDLAVYLAKRLNLELPEEEMTDE